MLPCQFCWPSRFSLLVLLPRPSAWDLLGLSPALAAVLSAPWPTSQLARLLIFSLL